MIRARIRGDFVPPHMNFRKELKVVADKIVIPELSRAIQHGEDIKGKKYAPLAASTVRMKAKRKTAQRPDAPLIETGKLHRSFISKSTANGARVKINSERKDIADRLQNEGVKTKSGRRFFNFFGVNDRMEDKAIAYMREQLRKRLASGR